MSEALSKIQELPDKIFPLELRKGYKTRSKAFPITKLLKVKQTCSSFRFCCSWSLCSFCNRIRPTSTSDGTASTSQSSAASSSEISA